MSKKLLLADDSITIQKVIGITFANEDYDLTVVDNGDAALAKARELHPDLCWRTSSCPGKNGYELCAAVKQDPALAGTPVLLLTGTFEPFDEDKARSAGADSWIAKPFESQSLIDRVEQLLAAAPAAAPVVEAVPGTARRRRSPKWPSPRSTGPGQNRPRRRLWEQRSAGTIWRSRPRPRLRPLPPLRPKKIPGAPSPSTRRTCSRPPRSWKRNSFSRKRTPVARRTRGSRRRRRPSRTPAAPAVCRCRCGSPTGRISRTTSCRSMKTMCSRPRNCWRGGGEDVCLCRRGGGSRKPAGSGRDDCRGVYLRGGSDAPPAVESAGSRGPGRCRRARAGAAADRPPSGSSRPRKPEPLRRWNRLRRSWDFDLAGTGTGRAPAEPEAPAAEAAPAPPPVVAAGDPGVEERVAALSEADLEQIVEKVAGAVVERLARPFSKRSPGRWCPTWPKP